jgi:hypothetical protein
MESIPMVLKGICLFRIENPTSETWFRHLPRLPNPFQKPLTADSEGYGISLSLSLPLCWLAHIGWRILNSGRALEWQKLEKLKQKW